MFLKQCDSSVNSLFCLIARGAESDKRLVGAESNGVHAGSVDGINFAAEDAEEEGHLPVGPTCLGLTRHRKPRWATPILVHLKGAR